MSTNSRRIIFLIAAIPVSALLIWGVLGLPPFGNYPGPYGIVIQRTTVPERHVTDLVTSVMFDQRGLDTLGEEFILFAAVVGVTLLLREFRTGGEETETRETSKVPVPKTNAVNVLGLIGAPVIFLFGVYVISQAHITVGGGFQGGIAVASAFLLLYIADERRSFRAVAPKRKVETTESMAAGSYVILGLLGVFAAVMFLQNVLPLGQHGQLLSGGTIPLINVAAGIEVTAAFVLLIIEFFKEAEKSETGEE